MAGRVYVSVPLSGPSASAGRELLWGADLALARADTEVEAVVLDGFAGSDRDAHAIEQARRAAADPDALAYLGDFHSSQVWATSRVLSPAGLLQVAPVATFSGLGAPTLVRLTPDDRAVAGAIASWLADAGIRRALVVHDHDDGYGVPVGGMSADAIAARGIEVRARPVWDAGEPLAPDVEGAGAVLYVGVAGSGAAGLWRELHALDPALWLLGTDGVATAWLAREIAPPAAERTRFFTALHAPFSFFGYEAMALVLDAVAAAGPTADRAAVGAIARATRDRESVLGRYSLDEHGLTTAPASGVLTVSGGELVRVRSAAAS